MFNPYLEEYNQIKYGFYDYKYRDELVQKYAWAIPNDEAIEAIKKLNKEVIEIGSGLGYWARVLFSAGVNVLAFDNFSWNMEFTEKWFDIKKGSIEKIKFYLEHALMLCWPNYDDPFAYDALSEYKGDTFIYVGEGYDGCTGDEKFHDLLNGKWNEIDSVYIPQWWGIHDYMAIYKRK